MRHFCHSGNFVGLARQTSDVLCYDIQSLSLALLEPFMAKSTAKTKEAKPRVKKVKAATFNTDARPQQPQQKYSRYVQYSPEIAADRRQQRRTLCRLGGPA
jgi:hypothetical protein